MEKTAKLYISPVYDQNIEKYGSNENQCRCCGKPIKDLTHASMIRC